MARAALPPVLPLFVYGTLRPGRRLHHLLEANVLDSCTAIADDHALYHVDSSRPASYPVMVAQPGSRTVGTLFHLRDDASLTFVLNMELAAGYDLGHVTATPQREQHRREGDNRELEPVRAAAFIWPHRHHGWRVPGDDWLNVPEPRRFSIRHRTRSTARKN